MTSDEQVLLDAAFDETAARIDATQRPAGLVSVERWMDGRTMGVTVGYQNPNGNRPIKHYEASIVVSDDLASNLLGLGRIEGTFRDFSSRAANGELESGASSLI